MGTLLCVVLLAASMTPGEEVAALDPVATSLPSDAAPESVVDVRANRMWRAAGVVTLGTAVAGVGAGAIAYLGFTTVNSTFAGPAYTVGNAVVGISSIAFLVGVPIVMLALFTDGLPASGLWVAGVATAFGTLVGLFTGAWLANAYVVRVAIETSTDCIGCGPEVLATIVLPPALAFVGGATLGVATTTLATLSE